MRCPRPGSGPGQISQDRRADARADARIEVARCRKSLARRESRPCHPWTHPTGRGERKTGRGGPGLPTRPEAEGSRGLHPRMPGIRPSRRCREAPARGLGACRGCDPRLRREVNSRVVECCLRGGEEAQASRLGFGGRIAAFARGWPQAERRPGEVRAGGGGQEHARCPPAARRLPQGPCPGPFARRLRLVPLRAMARRGGAEQGEMGHGCARPARLRWQRAQAHPAHPRLARREPAPAPSSGSSACVPSGRTSP